MLHLNHLLGILPWNKSLTQTYRLSMLIIPVAFHACTDTLRRFLSWDCCRSSGPGSATLWVHRMRSSWRYLKTRFFHQRRVSSLMARAYSKMTTPGFSRVRLWFRDDETSFSHMDRPPVRVLPSTPLRTVGMCWRSWAYWSNCAIVNTRYWWKINATPEENKSVTLLQCCNECVWNQS